MVNLQKALAQELQDNAQELQSSMRKNHSSDYRNYWLVHGNYCSIYMTYWSIHRNCGSLYSPYTGATSAALVPMTCESENYYCLTIDLVPVCGYLAGQRPYTGATSDCFLGSTDAA